MNYLRKIPLENWERIEKLDRLGLLDDLLDSWDKCYCNDDETDGIESGEIKEIFEKGDTNFLTFNSTSVSN